MKSAIAQLSLIFQYKVFSFRISRFYRNKTMAKIKGTSLNDILNGGTGNDSLYGYQGNDVLNGGSGNDTLDGGTGDDTMSGGVGNDTYIVDSSSDIVSEDNGLGGDAGRANASK
ncbi:hypothetical protein H6G41_17860 [Tolypothrix sp. FACHB-123]|nr:hypothetical protein [Tolypothrix sp. FACHB-123]